MKKTILMMLACFLSLTLQAQNAVTVQPKIMVVVFCVGVANFNHNYLELIC